MQYVVLGATGYIGSYLFRKLREDCIPVIGTSRRESSAGDGMVRYDISGEDGYSHLMSEISDGGGVAIVCIAEANIDRCLEHYNDAYKVNVARMKGLIHALSTEGFRVIFFSSDNVFDGGRGGYTEESGRSPVNSYGTMKKEMEDHLLSHEPGACILRIPKVVSAIRKKQNVFSEWTDAIGAGSIRCIKGNRLSFLSIDDIYQVCRIVAEKGLSGLYNIAGDKAYSRAELARMLYQKMGANTVDVREYGVDEFHFKERRPLNLSMSNAKFKSETGHMFETMESVIERYVKMERERWLK